MRGGNFLSRSNIALYEPPKPLSVSGFKGSSSCISQDDIETFYRARSFQVVGDFVTAKMLYIELIKKAYLRTNTVILHNIGMCDKEIG